MGQPPPGCRDAVFWEFSPECFPSSHPCQELHRGCLACSKAGCDPRAAEIGKKPPKLRNAGYALSPGWGDSSCYPNPLERLRCWRSSALSLTGLSPLLSPGSRRLREAAAVFSGLRPAALVVRWAGRSRKWSGGAKNKLLSDFGASPSAADAPLRLL